MAKTLEARLDLITNSVLAVIYNSVSDRQVSKFSDHSTAVKRTLAALEARGRDIVNRGDGTFDVVDVSVTAAIRDGDDRVITVTAERNPKGKGTKSARRFDLYRSGMTVADYIAATAPLGGGRRKAIRDIAWDIAHGFITVD